MSQSSLFNSIPNSDDLQGQVRVLGIGQCSPSASPSQGAVTSISQTSSPTAISGSPEGDQDQEISISGSSSGGNSQPNVNVNSSSQMSSQGAGLGSGLDCPICLQSCIHPVELPCRHIFCFLCVKGVVTQGGPQPRCAICRQDIPANVLTNPTLKDVTQLYNTSSTSGFLWYYESRGGGWWEYDERTMQELEKAYEGKQTSTQLMIAGHLYEVNFPQMIQHRIGNPNLFRRIKRDMPRNDKRGIAGIRVRPRQGGSGGSNSGNGSRFGGTAGGGDVISISGPIPGSSTSSYPGYSSGVGQGQSQSHRQNTGANSHKYYSPSNIETVINSVATNSAAESSVFVTQSNENHVSSSTPTTESDPSPPTPGNSVTFFIPQPVVACNGYAETEIDGDGGEEEEDSLDDDEDMEFGEEDDETTEEEYYDEFDVRDGARAPTARSDRSTSSSNHNQTPPPDSSDASASASRSGSSVGKNRTRGGRNSNNSTRTTPVDVSRSGSSSGSASAQVGLPFSPTPREPNGDSCSPSTPISTPTSPAANIRVGGVSVNTPLTIGNNNGVSSTCIRIGPSLRITVDYDTAAVEDEVL